MPIYFKQPRDAFILLYDAAFHPKCAVLIRCFEIKCSFIVKLVGPSFPQTPALLEQLNISTSQALEIQFFSAQVLLKYLSSCSASIIYIRPSKLGIWTIRNSRSTGSAELSCFATGLRYFVNSWLLDYVEGALVLWIDLVYIQIR